MFGSAYSHPQAVIDQKSALPLAEELTAPAVYVSYFVHNFRKYRNRVLTLASVAIVLSSLERGTGSHLLKPTNRRSHVTVIPMSLDNLINGVQHLLYAKGAGREGFQVIYVPRI